MKVIEIPGIPVDDTIVDHPTFAVEKIRREGNRWRVVVELTWDVLPDDVTEKYEGDAEVDFASRGFARVRGALETLIGYANRGGPRDDTAAFQHYHILELPKRVTEFD
jgi:hypothetical protein